MSTDSTTIPSPRRWSAFSVAPPSESWRSVCATVSHVNASPTASRRDAGRVVISSGWATLVRQAASSTCRARNAGSPRPPNQATSDSGVSPEMPGGRARMAASDGWMIVGTGVGMGEALSHATRARDPIGARQVARTAGWPRRNAAAGIGRPPGRLDVEELQSAVGGDQGEPVTIGDEQAGPISGLARQHGRAKDDEVAGRRLEVASPAMAGTRGPGARARRPAGPGPAARRTCGGAVSWWLPHRPARPVSARRGGTARGARR